MQTGGCYTGTHSIHVLRPLEIPNEGQSGLLAAGLPPLQLSLSICSCSQAGEVLLREHVFIHVERPLDKLNALIAMTGKLFALVADLCGEDNADALSHHEVLLPGTLLSKFVSDKLAESLAIVKRQVSSL